MESDVISPDVLDEIRGRVEALRSEVESLEEQIKARRMKIGSWERILALAHNIAGPQELPLPRGGRFEGLTAADATEIILKEAGHALHLTEILKRLNAGGWSTTAKQPISNLSTMLQRSGKFRRVAPGVYELLSGEDRAEVEAREETELRERAEDEAEANEESYQWAGRH